MSWMLMAIIVWTAVAVALALVIGRSIRIRDERDERPVRPVAPDFVPAEWALPAAGPR